jgi:hypothetical protein
MRVRAVRRRLGPLLAMLAWCPGGCDGADPDPAAKAPAPEAADAGTGAGRAAGDELIDGVLVLPVAGPSAAALPAGARDRLETCRRAAPVAEDIHLALGGPGWLAARDTLERILASPGDTPPAILAKIRDFASRFFLWHGVIDPRGGRRLLPRFIPGELAAAAEAASLAGAALPLPESSDPAATPTERLEALLALLRPLLFPPRGARAADGPDASPDGGVPSAGEVESGLARLLGLLAPDAKPAGPRPRQLLPGGHGPELAVIFGFLDEGRTPGFGALLAVPDPESAPVATALAASSAVLRRRVEETGGGRIPAGRYAPRAVVPVSVADATGAFGPVLEAGLFPLLDGPVIADPNGDRVLLAVNLARALDGAAGMRALVRLSSPDDGTADRRLEHRACSRLARHVLAAVAGTGTDGTEQRPRGFAANRLGRAAPVMERLRELLSALLLAGAPGITEALPGGTDCSRAVLDDFAASAVEHLLDTPGGREAPAAVARRIALGRLLERGGLGAAEREGRAVLAVADEGKLREAVAELLGEVRSIRYNGDGEAARALIDRHGAIPPSWSTAAASLTAAIGGITTAAFFYPPADAREPPAGLVEARIDRARRRALGLDAF